MKRDILDKLASWKNKKDRKPLILEGARQVGKTFVLEEFGKKYFTNYHYLNFEKKPALCEIFEKDLDPLRIINDINLKIQTKINIEKDLLIFDEVQCCPKAITSLKYFCEDLPEMTVCAAGSLLGVRLGNVSFPVGKVDRLDMFPMSFAEFLLGIGDDLAYERFYEIKAGDSISESIHEHFWEKLKLYFITGGLPKVVQIFKENQKNLFDAFNLVREEQKDLVEQYLNDIAKYCGKENSMHIRRVWESVPEQLAREQDGSASRFRFRGIIPGVSQYSRLVGAIDWLKATRLVIESRIVNHAELPLSAFTKYNIFKLYLFDVGILGALSDLAPSTIYDYDYGTYKGYFAENFIAQEFVYGESNLKNIFAWKENIGEVEFLKQIEGKIIPIEVKSGWVTQAKSIKVFREKYKPPYIVKMSGKNLTIDKGNKVHNYPLYLASRLPLKD